MANPGWSESVAHYWDSVPGAKTAGVQIAPFGTGYLTAGTGGQGGGTGGHGGGTGLAGLSERARLAGGWLEAGSGPEGGFVVRAFLPDSR